MTCGTKGVPSRFFPSCRAGPWFEGLSRCPRRLLDLAIQKSTPVARLGSKTRRRLFEPFVV